MCSLTRWKNFILWISFSDFSLIEKWILTNQEFFFLFYFYRRSIASFKIRDGIKVFIKKKNYLPSLLRVEVVTTLVCDKPRNKAIKNVNIKKRIYEKPTIINIPAAFFLIHLTPHVVKNVFHKRGFAFWSINNNLKKFFYSKTLKFALRFRPSQVDWLPKFFFQTHTLRVRNMGQKHYY